MQIIIQVFVKIVTTLLSVLEVLMVVRAISSWFPFDEESRLMQFLYVVTEPIILPVRAVIDRIPFFRDMPIDMSFFFTMLLLGAITFFLPEVTF